ncbi:ATP-dependent DNA helicase [Brumimicrobium salinarum]|uniref:DNA 3'-5' helicase n=1 Tax=Brumimicrobium salinarum TaxID=2058658 RepID=A0A2I0R3U2_9FLAO|nr:UvrD-helicase domain-containing protein [Brumimicrobium salinarum]PKR81238.1 ATP-dependent DNA helicase [Brumimicrobium salinarum]
MNYLEGLNESQLNAVKNIDGPMMVIAGAGSGKTRVLTYRIAHLMRQGVDSFNILALTFTNKAAKEMKERINSIIGGNESMNITMGTFHSVFARILRYNSDKLGYPSNFTIYDTQDSRSLIKMIVKEFGLDDKVYKANAVHGRISSAKNNLISPQAYEANVEIVGEDRMAKKPEIFRIYKEYVKRCFQSGAMDFDDLLYQTNVLLRDFPDVLHHYQQKFKYILVDEYQDTNYSQYLIVKKLAAVYENICVVGDDAQSIYSFRGANIENILNFKKDYPDFKMFKLEQNYRSTSNIVNAANSIIKRNKDQIEKDVWTDNSEGGKINVIRCLTDNEEGRVITNRIYEIKQRESIDYKDFAILYRTNAQSRSFEESLRKLNLPYKIYGGLSFYQRKEIKDLIAYFRLSANEKDEEALKRVINYPKRGIGKTTMDNIILAARQYDVAVWDVISDFNRYPVSINAGARNKISQFVTKIQSYAIQMEKTPAYELANNIAQSSGILKNLYDDKTPEGVARYENIQELLAGIKEFSVQQEEKDEVGTLSDFLIDVALLTDADQEKEEDKNTITLMTIHASKGLEFPHVFIVGLEENLFPSQLSLTSRTELEEERRLFYVALTRAEKSCTLSYVVSRYRWGQLVTAEPSRFIDEVDQSFVNVENEVRGRSGGKSLSGYKRPSDNRTSGFGMMGGKKKRNLTPLGKSSSTPPSKKGNASGGTTEELKVGYNVEHARFGKGKVTAISGTGSDKKASVFFPRVGAKTLILKFAKLTVLES